MLRKMITLGALVLVPSLAEANRYPDCILPSHIEPAVVAVPDRMDDAATLRCIAEHIASVAGSRVEIQRMSRPDALTAVERLDASITLLGSDMSGSRPKLRALGSAIWAKGTYEPTSGLGEGPDWLELGHAAIQAGHAEFMGAPEYRSIIETLRPIALEERGDATATQHFLLFDIICR